MFEIDDEIENSPPNSQERHYEGRLSSTSSNCKRGRLRLSASKYTSAISGHSSSRQKQSVSTEEELKWVCDHCTLENDLALSNCELCEGTRPKGGLNRIQRTIGSIDNYHEKELKSKDVGGEEEVDVDEDEEGAFSSPFPKARRAVPSVNEDEGEDDFEPGSLIRINCHGRGRGPRDDEIEESDEEGGGGGQPRPSFPEISETFMTVRDLKRYGLCGIDFDSLMMKSLSARDYDRKVKKMEDRATAKDLREEKKKEKKKAARAAKPKSAAKSSKKTFRKPFYRKKKN